MEYSLKCDYVKRILLLESVGKIVRYKGKENLLSNPPPHIYEFASETREFPE